MEKKDIINLIENKIEKLEKKLDVLENTPESEKNIQFLNLTRGAYFELLEVLYNIKHN